MKKGLIIGLVVVAVIVISIIGFFVGTYNRIIVLEQKVNEAYSQIQNNLQRRTDLIPNLVETVKGFAAQERSIIDSITEARAKLAGAKTVAEQAAADAELTSALSRLLVVVENYPTLKSDQTFIQLMDELAGTENRIAIARRDYNQAVKEYNTAIKRFPAVLVANMFGFKEKEYFEAKPGAEEVPQVKF